MSEKTLKKPDVIGETKSKKGRIVFFSIILIIACVLFNIIKAANTTCIAICTHFASSSDGLKPDGSPFDIHEILSDEVLGRASEKLGGEIDVQTLRNHLSIAYDTTYADNEELVQNIRDGETDYTAFPTRYVLTYKTVSENIQNDGFFASCGAFFKQFTLPGKKEILVAVTESYKEYYEEKYVQDGDFLNIDWTTTDSLDYYNKADSISLIAGRMNRFVQKKYDENTNFVSDKGIGYGELCSEIGRIVSVDLENYKSFVIQKGLTQDKPTLLRRFTYMEDKSLETNKRETARYNVIKEGIEFYDANVTKVVFIPALDDSDSFYMNRTKVGIDYLVEMADTAKIAADNTKHDAINYRYLIRQFDSTKPASETTYEIADAMYSDLKSKVDSFGKDVLYVLTEENEVKNLVSVDMGEAYTDVMLSSVLISSVKTFILFVLVFYVVINLFGFIKSRKRREI